MAACVLHSCGEEDGAPHERTTHAMAQRWQQASLAARIAVGCAALVSVCSGCVIIFALGFAAGLNSPRTASSRAANTAAPQGTHAPTATAKAKAWVTVKHLAGSGNSQSDTFE